MSSKVCKACGVLKPLNEYYKHPKMADGHLNKCKECQKENSRQAREKNAEQYRQYDKDRANNPDRVAARREYSRTEAGKESHAKAIKKYQQTSTLKRAAHILVGNALRDGKIVRAEVYETCGSSGKIEGHHDDYTKPLEVRWLCERCHKDWHLHNEPIYQ